jgi:hypothetical protein
MPECHINFNGNSHKCSQIDERNLDANQVYDDDEVDRPPWLTISMMQISCFYSHRLIVEANELLHVNSHAHTRIDVEFRHIHPGQRRMVGLFC